MGLLSDILAHKATEVAAMGTLPARERPAGFVHRNVMEALRRPRGGPLRLIAEVKFMSPSAGALSRRLDAADRAEVYERAGAAMVSVLTDGRWFGGSFDDLSAARERVTVPVLSKDFVVDRVQVEQSWAAGADAVLVIVRCLREAGRVRGIVEAIRHRGLEPFVEVIDEDELAIALDAGARVIGVNARDLDTLAMDADRAHRIIEAIPAEVVAVHFSGLKTGIDAARIAASRADAALVGEVLMRRDDPAPLLTDLVRQASRPRAPG
jgi:indole-3-glycerol phosphate synthase